MATLKEQGVDYEDRIAELEKLEYPKPEAEFIYQTFNAFEARHPWIAGEAIRPKSIAREMYENFQTFDEYIREYELQRSEGILLRYLSSVYRALSQTIPDLKKTDEVRSIEDYFGSMVRDVDSSLLQEWRAIEVGQRSDLATQQAAQEEADAAALAAASAHQFAQAQAQQRRDLTIMARNAVARFVRAFALGDFVAALRVIDGGVPQWNEDNLKQSLEDITKERGRIMFHTHARAQIHTKIAEAAAPEPWKIEQTLIDESESNDALIVFELDTTESLKSQKAKLKLIAIEQ
jgi:hypothetical protein